mmetsp:Transcript_96773/g.273446  ORF Transcript_96773/g.273446 Transcript_96773/m.273446 type:complete len:406 (-) Transcript_96773:553-1770(-)
MEAFWSLHHSNTMHGVALPIAATVLDGMIRHGTVALHPDATAMAFPVNELPCKDTYSLEVLDSKTAREVILPRPDVQRVRQREGAYGRGSSLVTCKGGVPPRQDLERAVVFDERLARIQRLQKGLFIAHGLVIEKPYATLAQTLRRERPIVEAPAAGRTVHQVEPSWLVFHGAHCVARPSTRVYQHVLAWLPNRKRPAESRLLIAIPLAFVPRVTIRRCGCRWHRLNAMAMPSILDPTAVVDNAIARFVCACAAAFACNPLTLVARQQLRRPVSQCATPLHQDAITRREAITKRPDVLAVVCKQHGSTPIDSVSVLALERVICECEVGHRTPLLLHPVVLAAAKIIFEELRARSPVVFCQRFQPQIILGERVHLQPPRFAFVELAVSLLWVQNEAPLETQHTFGL